MQGSVVTPVSTLRVPVYDDPLLFIIVAVNLRVPIHSSAGSDVDIVNIV